MLLLFANYSGMEVKPGKRAESLPYDFHSGIGHTTSTGEMVTRS